MQPNDRGLGYGPSISWSVMKLESELESFKVWHGGVRQQLCLKMQEPEGIVKGAGKALGYT
jgi:hypothetical protein